jgi:hypothetical protein
MTKHALGILGVALTLAATGCDDGGGGSTDTGRLDGGGTDGGGTDGGGGTDTGGGGGGTFCAEECTDAADCEIDGMNTLGFVCTDGRCTLPSSAGCSEDAECVAQLSGWSQVDSDDPDFLPDTPCTADGPTLPATCADGEVCCATGQVCLEGGFCASPADGVVSCETLTRDEVEATGIGGDSVMVCGDESAADATCESGGVCRNPCEADADCAGDVFPTCNTTTGNCECEQSPNSCAGNPVGGTVCQANGTCGCAENDDCMGDGFDTCYDGVCGCSDASVCSDTMAFDGTTIVCE